VDTNLKLFDYFPLIRQWAGDRGLLDSSLRDRQFLKLIEEFGELAGGIARGNLGTIKDSIGDMLVVITIHAAQNKINLEDVTYQQNIIYTEDFIPLLVQAIRDLAFYNEPIFYSFFVDHLEVAADCYNFELEECLAAAWEEIKNRKGKTTNGIFVKEEDLK
jgi:hypothetical protein